MNVIYVASPSIDGIMNTTATSRVRSERVKVSTNQCGTQRDCQMFRRFNLNELLYKGKGVHMMFLREKVLFQFVPKGPRGRVRLVSATLGPWPVGRKKTDVSVPYREIKTNNDPEAGRILKSSSGAENSGTLDDNLPPYIFVITLMPRLRKEHLNRCARAE